MCLLLVYLGGGLSVGMLLDRDVPLKLGGRKISALYPQQVVSWNLIFIHKLVT